ncbi:MAG: DNA-processing protein DprA [Planctomycetota bacterium]
MTHSSVNASRPVDLSDEERRARLVLWRASGLGPIRATAILDRFGSALDALGASGEKLRSVTGIGQKLAASLPRALRDAEIELTSELTRIEDAGARVIVRGDASYPSQLAAVPDGPLALIIRGEWTEPEIERPAVGLVGSRRASAYGIEQAERFARSLANSGLSVISGGARGIDAAAHRGALRGGGRTVVVLGSGLLSPYPPEHASFFDDIASNGGAVVSELPCATPPSPEQFPRRNRIISGLSLGILVIEAGARSGALITARHALETHGRDVMALPGRIDTSSCAGSNELLKDGALLVTTPADVLAALEHDAWLARPRPAQSEQAEFEIVSSESKVAARDSEFGESGAQILAALDGLRTPDDISRETQLCASTVRSQLTLLELGGHVVREGTRFRRQ